MESTNAPTTNQKPHGDRAEGVAVLGGMGLFEGKLPGPDTGAREEQFRNWLLE
jgi:hypothetical protein